MKKYEFFKVDGNKINRVRRHCMKCGPAVFLGEHKDRFSCGKCGYTEYKGGVKPAPPPKIIQKPVVQTPPVVKKVQTEEKPAEKPAKQEAPKA
jgi:small subunit ribosomal protein S27Ae